MDLTALFSLTQSESLSLIFSGVVALSTIVYAILTWKLVAETKKMREKQTEPVISIIIEQSDQWINLIDLVVRNIGLGPAYNLQFTIDPDFKYKNDKKLSDINLIKNGIQYLAPQQEIKFFLTSLVDDYQIKKENPFVISVSYESYTKKKYKREYPIDFSIWEGMSFIGGNSLVKISKNLEDISKDFHHLTTGFSRMKMICYSQEDLEREQQDFLERREKMKKGNEVDKYPY